MKLCRNEFSPIHKSVLAAAVNKDRSLHSDRLLAVKALIDGRELFCLFQNVASLVAFGPRVCGNRDIGHGHVSPCGRSARDLLKHLDNNHLARVISVLYRDHEEAGM
jgi:hypothetical protein